MRIPPWNLIISFGFYYPLKKKKSQERLQHGKCRGTEEDEKDRKRRTAEKETGADDGRKNGCGFENGGRGIGSCKGRGRKHSNRTGGCACAFRGRTERNVRALPAAPSEGRTRGRGRKSDRKNTGDPPPDRGEKGGTREAGGETEEDCEESENNKTLGTDGKGGWCCVGCGGVRFWSQYDERGESDSVGGDD